MEAKDLDLHNDARHRGFNAQLREPLAEELHLHPGLAGEHGERHRQPVRLDEGRADRHGVLRLCLQGVGHHEWPDLRGEAGHRGRPKRAGPEILGTPRGGVDDLQGPKASQYRGDLRLSMQRQRLDRHSFQGVSRLFGCVHAFLSHLKTYMAQVTISIFTWSTCPSLISDLFQLSRAFD